MAWWWNGSPGAAGDGDERGDVYSSADMAWGLYPVCVCRSLAKSVVYLSVYDGLESRASSSLLLVFRRGGKHGSLTAHQLDDQRWRPPIPSSMHYDSSLHPPNRAMLLLAFLALFCAVTQALLIPPQVTREDVDAIQLYNELIEALHEQSGGFHERFKALKVQQGAEHAQLPVFQADDNVHGDKKKGKQPKDGDGDKDGPKLVPVVLGVMSKWVTRHPQRFVC